MVAPSIAIEAPPITTWPLALIRPCTCVLAMSTVSEECEVIQFLNSRGKTVGSDRSRWIDLDVLLAERLGLDASLEVEPVRRSPSG